MALLLAATSITSLAFPLSFPRHSEITSLNWINTPSFASRETPGIVRSLFSAHINGPHGFVGTLQLLARDTAMYLLQLTTCMKDAMILVTIFLVVKLPHKLSWWLDDTSVEHSQPSRGLRKFGPLSEVLLS